MQTDTKVRVARQPICDTSHRTFAYELLFRDSRLNRANVRNPERATADVIVNSFMEIGMDRMVGGKLAFINVTRDFIVSGHCKSLPKERVVLEILEDTTADFELIVELSRLRATGYRFALDDFAFKADEKSLLPYSDYVKIDLRETDRATIERELPSIYPLGVSLIAEKVETKDEYDFCSRMGFSYYQGYFFCRPHIMTGNSIAANRALIFRLLAELHNPEVNPRQMEEIVAQDVSLSYKLLRYINSAFIGLPHTIESVAHAVRMLGIDHVRNLASLIMLSTVNDKPRELIHVSLIRAKMCELIADRMGFDKKDSFFTVGLFSALDAFLDKTLAQAIASLPLSDRVRRALLGHEGHLGETLHMVLNYEQTCLEPDSLDRIEISLLHESYWQAVDWHHAVLGHLA